MTDLRKRLDVVNKLDPPKMWEEVQRRSVQPIQEELHAPEHGRFEPPRAPSLTRRILIACVALMVAVASFIFLTRAFRHANSEPVARTVTPTPSVAPKNAAISKVLTYPAPWEPNADMSAANGVAWITVGSTTDARTGLARIDASTDTLTVFPTAGKLGELAAVDDGVWGMEGGTSGGPRVLVKFDNAGTIVAKATLSVGFWPIYGPMAATSAALWIMSTEHSGAASLLHIDPTTLQVIGSTPIDTSRFQYSREVVQVADGAVWVLDDGREIVKVDPSTGAVLARASVEAQSMAVGTTAVWATRHDPNMPSGEWNAPRELLALDLNTLQVIGTSPTVVGGYLTGASGTIGYGSGGVWLLGYDRTMNHGVVARYLPSGPIDQSVRLPRTASIFSGAVIDTSANLIWVAAAHSVVRIDLPGPAR